MIVDELIHSVNRPGRNEFCPGGCGNKYKVANIERADVLENKSVAR